MLRHHENYDGILGDLNPGQYILAKKVMKKIKFRLKLYQLSYAAILHKIAKSYYAY